MDDFNLEDFKAGDEGMFTKVYNEYHGKLTAQGLNIISDPEVVCELVHDTFMKLWKAPGRINDLDHLIGFLYTAMRNNCLNECIRSGRHPLTVEFDPSLHGHQLEQHIDNKTIEALFTDFMHQHAKELTPQQEQFIRWKKIDGLTNDEIAQKAGVSLSTVGSAISRAWKFYKGSIRIY